MDYIGIDELVSISCIHEGCDSTQEFLFKDVVDMYEKGLKVGFQFCSHMNVITSETFMEACDQIENAVDGEAHGYSLRKLLQNHSLEDL